MMMNYTFTHNIAYPHRSFTERSAPAKMRKSTLTTSPSAAARWIR